MALGSFHDLFLAVTANPAMLVFLDGIYNDKDNPNENYAREMMELFSLGADRGAYTEDDVREMARALDRLDARNGHEAGPARTSTSTPPATTNTKRRCSGRRATGTGKTRYACASTHPLHASFFVTKLWGYFIPSPPDEATLASLQGLVHELGIQHPRGASRRSSSTPTSTKARSS